MKQKTAKNFAAILNRSDNAMPKQPNAAMTSKQIAICTLITIHSDGDDTKDIGNLLIALSVSVDEIREALELQSQHDIVENID